MKKREVSLIAGLVILMIAGYFANHYYNSVKAAAKTVSQPMQVAFQHSKAVFSETKIQGWTKINDQFSSRQELLGYGEEVKRVLGLADSVTREEASDQGFNSLKLTGQISEKLSVEIIFQSLLDKKKENETYLIINMVDYRGPEFLSLTKEEMQKAFQVFHQKPRINQLMIGFREGKLTKNSYRETINGIFSAIGGRINGEVEEENYFSKTGYVPNMEEKLKIGRKDVNIQVAMAYDELENKTYIYIGSPLVYSDY